MPVQASVDGRGHDHAAERRDGGQRHLAALRQLARNDFALDLEPDQQEEDRHQQVVDPDEQGLVELERTDLQLDRGLQERLVQLESGEFAVIMASTPAITSRMPLADSSFRNSRRAAELDS